MSRWPTAKAKRVLAALLRIGWSIKRQWSGSHRTLSRPGWPAVVFTFHDREEIGATDAGTHLEIDWSEAGGFVITFGHCLL